MGQFISGDIWIATYVRARLVVDFSPKASNNTSEVSAYVQMWRTNSGYTTYGQGTLYIGVDGYGWGSSSITTSQKITQNSYTQVGATRTLTITHGSDGKWSANFYVYTSTNNSNMNFSQQTYRVTLDPNPVYSLSISAGTGSSISVNRTYCAGGGWTGNIGVGTKNLYHGDTLKIVFSPSTNYAITTSTVNGGGFTSGNTYTVGGNVSVVAAATPLKSDVRVTNADIGATSIISITRYNNSYRHTLTYNFGGLTGTIAVKTSETTVSWTIPTEFYSKIPNAPSGTCTVTCETFNGNTSLGSNSCTFTVTAEYTPNQPIISAGVGDTNTDTIYLTGNYNVLIRGKSTAFCEISVTPRNYATVSQIMINGAPVSGTVDSNGVVKVEKSYPATTSASFVIYAKDSRGYSNEITLTPTVIDYIPVTCNPTLYRDTPTGNTISMEVVGNFYRGSFGAYSNTLTLKYRYKKSGELYPSTTQTLEDGSTSDALGWITADSTLFTRGIQSYTSSDKINMLSYPETDESGNTTYPGFDYHYDYDFQVKVSDGVDEYILSSVTKTVTVSRGIPTFDWGENDFNFNVPIMLHNTNILDIVFPVGAIYIHKNNTLPSALASVGTWESTTSGISGTYAWERTS